MPANRGTADSIDNIWAAAQDIRSKLGDVVPDNPTQPEVFALARLAEELGVLATRGQELGITLAKRVKQSGIPFQDFDIQEARRRIFDGTRSKLVIPSQRYMSRVAIIGDRTLAGNGNEHTFADDDLGHATLGLFNGLWTCRELPRSRALRASGLIGDGRLLDVGGSLNEALGHLTGLAKTVVVDKGGFRIREEVGQQLVYMVPAIWVADLRSQTVV